MKIQNLKKMKIYYSFISSSSSSLASFLQGPVRFYNNERKASFLLKQFQLGEWVKIGEFNSLYNRLDLTLGSPIKWVSLFAS